MLRNFRIGHATNSSSSHSVIVHKSDKRIPDRNPDWMYGWENFVLNDARDKFMYYLADQPSLDVAYLDDVAKKLGFRDVLDAKRYDTIDHESVGTAACPSGVDPKVWLDFLLSDDVTIYGGNDNDDARFPLGYGFGLEGVTARFDRWRQDGDALIGYDRLKGVKMRWSPTAYDKSTTPELVDLKITDFCGYGCSFCYQGSTKAGKHAPLTQVKGILRELANMGVFEVAIGGGEPAHHPDFEEILDACMRYGITPNFTSYGTDWVKKLPKNYRGGVGMSVHKSEDLIKIERAREQLREKKVYGVTIMAQAVVGATPENTLWELLEECIARRTPLLLLGYKTTGRAANTTPAKMNAMEAFLKRAQQAVQSDDLDWYYPFQLSVDTAFLDQYGDALDAVGIPEVLRTSPEGKFSMYIDAVTDTCGPSSYAPDKMEPMKDIKEQFAQW